MRFDFFFNLHVKYSTCDRRRLSLKFPRWSEIHVKCFAQISKCIQVVAGAIPARHVALQPAITLSKHVRRRAYLLNLSRGAWQWRFIRNHVLPRSIRMIHVYVKSPQISHAAVLPAKKVIWLRFVWTDKAAPLDVDTAVFLKCKARQFVT